VIAGVVTRGSGSGLLADFVRPVPGRGFSSHCHAVVFPYRPLRRGGLDLPATGLSLLAVIWLFVLKRGVFETLAVAAAGGLVLKLALA
jgi:hypothetical protein